MSLSKKLGIRSFDKRSDLFSNVASLFTKRAGNPIEQKPLDGRLVFVDAAKGLSIILVVALHVGTYWHLNEFMRFVRMPLFFFVAGLFASQSMRLPLADFTRQKVGNTLYLFLLWVISGG